MSLYYLKIKKIRRLSGLRYYRLALYTNKNILVKFLGFYDLKNRFWFIKFSSLMFYFARGLNINEYLLRAKHFGRFSLNGSLIVGFFRWLISNRERLFNIPKKEWRLYARFLICLVDFGYTSATKAFLNTKIVKKRGVRKIRNSDMIFKKLY